MSRHTLPDFTLERPTTLDQALTALAHEPDARAIAGGTDLLPNMRHGLAAPPRLIDLSGLPGMAEIGIGADGALELGAGVTLARLASDPDLARHLPALAEAARAAAGPGHRSAATLGGNLCQDTRCIYYNQSAWWRQTNGYCLKRDGDTCHVAPQGKRCHAAFCSDLAPVLLAQGAEIELVSARATRRLPLADLYQDDGADHLLLEPDELLTRVFVPAPMPGQRCGYRKARVRAGMDFPLAAVAVSLVLRAGVVERLAVGISGTNSRPLQLEGLDVLKGQAVDEALIAAVGKAVQKQVSPMRSTTTESNYRRQVAATMAQRLVRSLADEAAEALAR